MHLAKTQIGADVNYHHLNHGERFEMKLQCQDSALMMPKTCLGRSSLVDRRMELARVQDADDMQPAASRELELVDGELSFPVPSHSLAPAQAQRKPLGLDVDSGQYTLW